MSDTRIRVRRRGDGLTKWFVPLYVAVLVGCCLRADAQQLSLRSILAGIGRTHPALRAAEGALASEEGRYLQALSPQPPELMYHEEEVPSGGRLGEGAQKFLQISQAFDIPLLTGSRAAMHARFADAAGARRDHVQLQVRAAAITAYAAFFSSERRLVLLQRGAELAREFAAKAAKRAESGESTRLESMRAAASAAVAEAAVAAGMRDRASALGRLSEALGRPLETATSCADSLEAPDTEEPAQADPSLHPAVREAQMRADGYGTDAARRWMQYMPGFRAAVFRQDVATMGRFWGAEFTLSVPLWFLLDARGRSEESAGLAMQADAEYRMTALAASSRIDAAEAGLRAARAALSAYSDAILRETEEMLRTARLAYDAGELSYLEYIDAQRGAQDVRLGYWDALAQAYAAVAEYELAAGRTILR